MNSNSKSLKAKFTNAEKLFVSQFCYDEPDETLEYLKNLRKIEIDQKKIANINRNIADIYLEKAFSLKENPDYQIFLFNEALKNYQTFLDFFDGSNQDSVKIHNNIGIINYNLGNHDEALASYDRSLATIENLKQTDLNADDKIILAKINHNIGNVFYDKEEYPEALNFFKKSLDIFKGLDIEDKYFKCVYMRMSFVYEKMGKHDEALECQRKASEFKRDDDLIPTMHAITVFDESSTI